MPIGVHFNVSPLWLITGTGAVFTTTICVAVALQIAFVTVTVYVVVLFGCMVMLLVVAPLLQLYVPPPVAVKMVLSPLHIVSVPLMLVTTPLSTVIVILSVFVQPPAPVPVTVYVVVTVGLAVTFVPIVALNPAAGDQLYVVAPVAVIVFPAPPEHIVALFGIMLTVGVGLTTTVTVWLSLHAPLVPVTV